MCGLGASERPSLPAVVPMEVCRAGLGWGFQPGRERSRELVRGRPRANIREKMNEYG